MGGLLLRNEINQHRSKTIDGVGRLTLATSKILNRKRIEGAVGHGVTID